MIMLGFLQMMTGVIVGLLSGFVIYNFVTKHKRAGRTEKQAVILLEKIKMVCKLVVVEGEFAEIYHHTNERDYLFGMFKSKKKALLLINAKAHIGFDLQRINFIAHAPSKKIILEAFPQPELLSFETSYKLYDIDEGVFNKFSPEEITQLNEDAKTFVREKIPHSGLMLSARKEASQAIQMIAHMIATVGWELDDKTFTLLQPTTSSDSSIFKPIKSS